MAHDDGMGPEPTDAADLKHGRRYQAGIRGPISDQLRVTVDVSPAMLESLHRLGTGQGVTHTDHLNALQLRLQILEALKGG